jgi:iron(III) transport system permease protein
LNGQEGRRTEVTRSGGEGVRRRVLSGSWVALLLAILGFLVIFKLLFVI